MPSAFKRPLGATIIALILWWLALGGFANALLFRYGVNLSDIPDDWPAKEFFVSAKTPLFTVIALLYGFTAAFAASGLWKLKPWMESAFLAWSGSVIAFGLWMAWALPSSLVPGGKAASFAFVGVYVLILLPLYLYVRKTSLRARSAAL